MIKAFLKENIIWSKCTAITNILIFWNLSKLHRLPLCERLTGIENDLLMPFPETEKVKAFNTSKQIILQVRLFPTP